MPVGGATVLKRLLIGLTVLVAAAIAAILVIPSFVDWNNARGWIAARMSELAGRPVAIGGEVGFAMLPTPHLTAEYVSVSGEGGGELLGAREIELRVLLLPLLLGRIEVESLALVEPVLRLERGPEAGALPQDGAAGPSPALRLGRIGIAGGTVLVADPALGATLRLADIEAEVTADSLDGPFEAGGRFSAGGVPAAFDLRTGTVAASGALPVTLRVAAADGAHGGRFAGLVAGFGRWQGDLSLQSDDIGALIARLGGGGAEGEASGPAALAQPFSLSASVEADDDEIALNGVSAELGESRGTGALSLVLADPLRADLTLSVNRVDVDAWPGGTPAPGDIVAALRPMPDSGFEMPAGLAATADLAIEAIRYKGGLVRQLRLEAALGSGVLAISRLSAQLPGGSDFGLIGSLRSEGGRPHFDLRTEAGANDLRGALAWLGIELAEVPSAQLRRFAGTAALSGTMADFRLTGVDLTVDNTRLTGGLAYVDRGVPGIGLRFDIDQLNLDAYRAAAEPGADWLALASAWARARWPALLEAVNANLEGHVGRLTVDGVTAADLRLDATLNNGALTLREASVGDLAGAVLRLSGTAERLAEPYALDLSGSATLPEPGRLAAAFGLDAGDALDRLAPIDLDGRLRLGEAELLTLTAAVSGGSLVLRGRPAQSGAGEEADAATAEARRPEHDAVDVTLRLRHSSLPDLIATGILGPGPADAQGSVDLYARLVGTSEAFALETLQGSLGPLTLAAEGRVSLEGERPAIEAEVRAGEIDLDDLLPASWQRRATGRLPAAPLDLSALRAFDADIGLTARRLGIGPYPIADPAATLSLSDGALSLDRLTGRLFGGQIGLSGNLSAGEPATAALRLDLVGADAAELLAAATGAEGLTGTADLGFAGESAGASLAALARNGQGEGLIAVRDGSISGIDLAALGEGLDRPGSALAFLETVRRALGGGRTAFAALNAPFVMSEGSAESDRVRLVNDLGIAEGSAAYDPLADRLTADLAFAFYAYPEAPAIRLLLDGRPEAPVLRYRAEALQDWALDRLSAGEAAESVP